MRAAVPFRFYRLSLFVALCCLPVVILQPSWSQASGTRDYPASLSQGVSKPAASKPCHYEIPLCQIHGLNQHTEQAAKEQELLGHLERVLKNALGDLNGERVETSSVSHNATPKSFPGKKGSFDILVVEEEISSVSETKVMRGTLRILPVFPPPGHPTQLFFDEHQRPEGTITPCFLGKTDEAEETRCRNQIVDDIKEIIRIHDNECHHGNACSPQN